MKLFLDGKGGQSRGHRLAHRLVDGALLRESHLRLAGMDIHVDQGRVDLNVDGGQRIPSRRQTPSVGTLQHHGQKTRADGAMIEEKVLPVAATPGDGRAADQAVDAKLARGPSDG